MPKDLREEILKLMKRSEELRKGSAEDVKEAREISRRLLEIQKEFDELKVRKAKKASGRLG